MSENKTIADAVRVIAEGLTEAYDKNDVEIPDAEWNAIVDRRANYILSHLAPVIEAHDMKMMRLETELKVLLEQIVDLANDEDEWFGANIAQAATNALSLLGEGTKEEK